ERLRYSLPVGDDLRDIYVPSLVLQTLVENAVKHGISQSIEGGEIRLSCEPQNNGFEIQVENSGASVTDKKKRSGGTGLENTIGRLNLLYGDRHDFDFVSDQNSTRVRFWISGENIGV